MILESIIPTNEQIEKLYVQLEKRVHNISHTHIPSFKEHEKFVLNHPYREWFILMDKDRAIGNVYIQFDNSIGLHFDSPKNFDKVFEVLRLIKISFLPLPAMPSVRIGEFFFRVPSGNHLLQERLSILGFHEVERVFVPITS